MANPTAWAHGSAVGNVANTDGLVVQAAEQRSTRILWARCINRHTDEVFVQLYRTADTDQVTPGTDRYQPSGLGIPADGQPHLLLFDCVSAKGDGFTFLASTVQDGTGASPATELDIHVAFEAV